MVADREKIFICGVQWNAYPQGACTLKAIHDLYNRDRIIWAVINNGSTDTRLNEWLHKHRDWFDIYIENPYNNGPTISNNQLILEFNKSPAQWYIYLENDAIPCTPYPATTLKILYEALKIHLKDKWPRVIGMSMKRRCQYPFDLLQGERKPTLKEYVHSLGKKSLHINGERKPDPMESYYAIPTMKTAKTFWSDDVGYISTSVNRANPLFMSICIHREVWDRLGYFSEASVGGDVEFYRRLVLTGFDYGLSSTMGFYANDFQYNKARYMDKGRWLGVKLFNMRSKIQSLEMGHAEKGQLFRGSIYDPKSLEKFNPQLYDKTYKDWAYENLQWYKENVQPDFSDGTPSWLEKDHPKYEEFKPTLIGKLRFLGDHKTADAVEKGEL